MHTEQIFEQWNIDPSSVVAEVHRLVGRCDVLLGGSLADDVGTLGSDLDLYCFHRGAGPTSRLPLITTCGEATMELYVVDVGTASNGDDDLRPLVVATEPPPPRRWPLLSAQRFRQLHALYRDRTLFTDGAAEEVRRAVGADLLHVYAGLRATLTAGTLAEDLAAFTGPEHATARLYCARLVVESAIDAALATRDLVNPNPKWRLLLAHRARLVDPGFPDPDRLLGAMFPDAGDPTRAVHECLTVAVDCLRLAAADGVLRRFPAVRTSTELVSSVASLSAPPTAAAALGTDPGTGRWQPASTSEPALSGPDPTGSPGAPVPVPETSTVAAPRAGQPGPPTRLP